MIESLRCTARETLAHELVEDVSGLDNEHAALHVEPVLALHLGPDLRQILIELRASNDVLRLRLRGALEADHPGIRIRDDPLSGLAPLSGHSQGRVVYADCGGPVPPRDGPAVAALVEELIVRIGYRATTRALADVLPLAREAWLEGEVLARQADAADAMAARAEHACLRQAHQERALRLRAQAAERVALARSHEALAAILCRTESHWRARWQAT